MICAFQLKDRQNECACNKQLFQKLHGTKHTILIMATGGEKTCAQTTKSRLGSLSVGLRPSKAANGMSFSVMTTAEEFAEALAILYEDANDYLAST